MGWGCRGKGVDKRKELIFHVITLLIQSILMLNVAIPHRLVVTIHHHLNK